MMTIPSAMHRRMARTNRKMTIALNVPLESAFTNPFPLLTSSWLLLLSELSVVYVDDEVVRSVINGNSISSFNLRQR